MDQVTILLERKQVDVQAQNDEFMNLKSSFARTEAQLAAHSDEKRALEGRLQQCLTQLRRQEERVTLCERDCTDKARQVRTDLSMFAVKVAPKRVSDIILLCCPFLLARIVLEFLSQHMFGEYRPI